MDEKTFTFSYLKKKFPDVSEDILMNISDQRVYRLLSDQCECMIRGVVLSDICEIQKSIEFTGSLICQIEEAFGWVEEYNPKRSVYNGLRRAVEYEYHPSVVREALVNAAAHCDYSLPYPVMIRILPQRIEIVSLGGGMNRLSEKEMLLGISLQRNPLLCDVMKKVGFMDGLGCGLQRLFAAYDGLENIPELYAGNGIVRVVLPKMRQIPTEYQNEIVELTDPMHDKVLMYLEEHGPVGRIQLEELLSASPSTVVRVLRKLKQKGQVGSEGNGKNTVYYSLRKQ